ncbi:hypothetical protein [Labrys okinawensis]|nr:hypothetical protein [Labrys okinawensis]
MPNTSRAGSTACPNCLQHIGIQSSIRVNQESFFVVQFLID